MAESIETLGEFGLIDRIAKQTTTQQPTTLKGIGDDCAVLSQSEGMVKVVTTDLLLEGIHFDLTYCPLKHLGYKAVAVNLSDVCAMNAYPRQITVSIGVSGKFTLKAIDDLYDGIRLACQRYGVDLVGGDTTSSLTGLTISITAIGEQKPSRLAYRNGARPNDILCVSGDLGAAYAGLQLLEREKRVLKGNNSASPALDGYKYILERQLKPEPRPDIVDFLEKIDVVPTSMMDVSDGLSSELIHICSQSEVGCRLYEDRVPLHAETKALCAELNINPIVAALNGGEDYELLFSIRQEDYPKFQSQPGPEIYAIGYVCEKEKGRRMITTGGDEADLQAQGWRFFTN
ncbi:MAG: thiamine-phosphate kinase [Bacteroidales bacterium]|nr:thiamine-phosphate kinase [Bacteroidales bacterium]MDY4175139.1 thiamine-phosphate kinase [Bacteroidales bacterium]